MSLCLTSLQKQTALEGMCLAFWISLEPYNLPLGKAKNNLQLRVWETHFLSDSSSKYFEQLLKDLCSDTSHLEEQYPGLMVTWKQDSAEKSENYGVTELCFSAGFSIGSVGRTDIHLAV